MAESPAAQPSSVLSDPGFPDVTESDWETAAEGALRGQPLSSLVTTLLDGIETAPLYTAQRNGTEADPAGLPGDAPFTRGATAASGGRGWEVRQIHDVRLASTPDAVAVDTTSGVDAVTVAHGWSAVDDAVLLDAAVGDAAGAGVTIHLQAGASPEHAEALLGVLGRHGAVPEHTRSWLGIDPIAAAAAGSQTSLADMGDGSRLAGQMAHAVARAVEFRQQRPQAIPLEADGSVFADAGATDVTELASMLATGTAWLRAACDADAGPRLEPAAAARLLGFTISAGPDPFVVTAKCRALRRSWARILAACAVDLRDTDGLPMPLHAVTSTAMASSLDPWVNMLRATTACFGAANGGVDAITVRPYDAVSSGPASSALGWRVAANTQLILRHESRIGSVIDPAGGSWYLEDLTRSMAHEAWDRFRRIEAAGGICSALASGELEARISQERAQRQEQIAAGDRVIVGVTQFADSLDASGGAAPPAGGGTDPEAASARTGEAHGGLGTHRWAAPFEAGAA
ncbi:methylmalonyl-CoA mutase family protein [Candidatus Poriferisodalis sp.]|uniref:methylmalonyl-CoA mutase family protein n=1 Tax=Candidatus Poriferisodalis sp. TaxID=3101277 RepID=UPI003B029E0E